jgi:hypothetical protein
MREERPPEDEALGHFPILPPVEMPGPSVPPPRFPESDTEREEWADRLKPDPEVLESRGQEGDLVAEEESAAMAEAREIGGPARRDSDDPAWAPLYEAGEGEEEGFELAEQDLIDNATHADGRGNPYRDALTPEVESDRSSADYGEPDEEELEDW